MYEDKQGYRCQCDGCRTYITDYDGSIDFWESDDLDTELEEQGWKEIDFDWLCPDCQAARARELAEEEDDD